MKAKDLLTSGETALAVFTHGDHLEINADGTGYTGIWVLDPKRSTDRVIIYWRKKMYPGEKNEIYIAERMDTVLSAHAGRYFVHFCKAEQVGETETKWYEFIGGGQNPVQYVPR